MPQRHIGPWGSCDGTQTLAGLALAGSGGVAGMALPVAGDDGDICGVFGKVWKGQQHALGLC